MNSTANTITMTDDADAAVTTVHLSAAGVHS